jgi:spore coat polysaccharide biosynthesis protein SpsF
MEKTDQEKFWAGEFGTEYSGRNVGANILASNISLFADIFKRIFKLNSVIEFGLNISLNSRALDLFYPGQEQVAVEINQVAANKVNIALPNTKVFNLVISEFDKP